MSVFGINARELYARKFLGSWFTPPTCTFEVVTEFDAIVRMDKKISDTLLASVANRLSEGIH